MRRRSYVAVSGVCGEAMTGAAPVIKKCCKCGCDFEPSAAAIKNKYYFCAPCLSERNRSYYVKNPRKRSLVEKICVVCGEGFHPFDKGQKTCSLSCRATEVSRRTGNFKNKMMYDRAGLLFHGQSGGVDEDFDGTEIF